MEIVLNIDYIVLVLISAFLGILLSSGFAYIFYKVRGNLLKKTIIGWIDEYAGTIMLEMNKNPEKFANLLKPVANAFLKGIGGQTGGEGNAPGVISFRLPLIGKITVPIELAAKFAPELMKGVGNVAQGKNPFE